MRTQPEGFTLTELMVCLAVAAILGATAMPAFTSMLERARVLDGFHALTASLMTARMTAISRRAPVTVCPSADGRWCRKDLVWDEGWLVYVDTQREEQPAHAGAILQHVSDPGRGLVIRSTVGRHRVRYQPGGWSGGSNVTLRVCIGKTPRHAGDVVVNLAGRPRTRPAPGDSAPCPVQP